MRGPAMAHRGSRRSSASSAATAPGSSRQSGFMISTNGARARASAWFTARPKPTFAALTTSVTAGANSCAMAALPSCDALSTTMPSHARPSSSRAIDVSAARSSSPAL